MPSDDVSDLRDVVDAINKLCDTMKTSSEDAFEDRSRSEDPVDLPLFLANEEVVSEETILAEVESDPDWYVTCRVETPEPDAVVFKKVEHYNTETWRQSVTKLEIVSPEDVVVQKTETYTAERWSDPPVNPEAVARRPEPQQDRWSDPSSRLEIVSPAEAVLQKTECSVERWSDSSVSLPGQAEEETVASDEPAQAQCEPFSEMYYTASSEVSLLSDLEAADKGPEEAPVVEKEDDRCVIAGHVAAMRERFESMTRTNTPCPDLIRSVSPTLDVFRNITPSPDHLG